MQPLEQLKVNDSSGLHALTRQSVAIGFIPRNNSLLSAPDPGASLPWGEADHGAPANCRTFSRKSETEIGFDM
jgi:hypothetical protein